MTMEVVIGRKNVKLFFCTQISPGSFPSHGTFSPITNRPPTRKIINPNNINTFPIVLSSMTTLLFYLFFLRKEASAIILPIYAI